MACDLTKIIFEAFEPSFICVKSQAINRESGSLLSFGAKNNTFHIVVTNVYGEIELTT